MKIALVTIFKSTNYGAVLQAYATKEIFSKYGKVNLVNYDSKFLANAFKLIRFNFSVHGFKMLIHDILRLPYSLRLYRNFKSFIRTNLNATRILSSTNLANGALDGFDVYVCGSDQIWNPEVVDEYAQFDSNYFLSFAKKGSLKISFASSIGHHIYNGEEQKKVYKELDSFSQISLRELDGVAQIKKILPHKNIHHINDPTLLMSGEEWLKCFDIQLNKEVEDYILVYSVPHSNLMKKAVNCFSEKLNMKIITIDKMLFPFTKTDKQYRNAGPIEFLKLFAEAKFVVTDSFHGTCFSLIFNKAFVSISPGKKSNRISSLLSLLNFENQLIGHEDSFNLIEANLDYENANVILEKIRSESKEFIRNSLHSQYKL